MSPSFVWLDLRPYSKNKSFFTYVYIWNHCWQTRKLTRNRNLTPFYILLPVVSTLGQGRPKNKVIFNSLTPLCKSCSYLFSEETKTPASVVVERLSKFFYWYFNFGKMFQMFHLLWKMISCSKAEVHFQKLVCLALTTGSGWGRWATRLILRWAEKSKERRLWLVTSSYVSSTRTLHLRLSTFCTGLMGL